MIKSMTGYGGAKGSVEGLEIGVCIYHKDDAFMKLYQEELADYLEAGGASVEVMDGKDDQEEQTSQIDNFITRGIDVLIINLVQTSAAEQITDKCAAAGVPVVFIAREPSPAEEYRWETEGIAAAYVGADAAQTGRCQGEIILELPDRGDVNGDGKVSYVLIQGDMENPDAQFRSEYAVRSLTDAGMEAEELYKQSGLWEEKEGRRIAEEALEGFLAAEFDGSGLSEEITKERIWQEFAQTSFAARFLERLSDDPVKLQMAYELLQTCRETEEGRKMT